MSENREPTSELRELLDALREDVITDAQADRLMGLLRSDAAARQTYIRYMAMVGTLRDCMVGMSTTSPVLSSPAYSSSTDPSTELVDDRLLRMVPSPIVSPVIAQTFPPSLASFVGSALFSYTVAAVIVGVGLILGASVYVSQPERHAGPGAVPQAPDRKSQVPNPSSIVGRITNVADCVWEGTGALNQNSEHIHHKSNIRLGDHLALRSGLLEITYNTGAKVILQGPVTYDVESAAGGYLSIGKLTACLEQKSQVKGQRSAPANQKSEITNQTFSIRTPTALVTDLGTEFGVEVNERGQTTSHVFQGLVRVQAVAADGKSLGKGRLLHENESATVDRNGIASETAIASPAKPVSFVRSIPKLNTKSLDLVDIVAGGDGYSHRRDRGIDATTGRIATAQPAPFVLESDRNYHRVNDLPLIDGVFVPDGSTGPVQLNSAGDTFADFPKTTGKTSGHLWAGGRIAFPDPPEVLRTEMGGIEYASPDHGVLFLHANKAVTFDLEAIRRANPKSQLVRFRSIAANTEPYSEAGKSVYADIWVFVDRELKYRRRQINASHGVFDIQLPLGDKDRFLTLVATDGGDGGSCDWIMFGDPRLELQTIPPAPVRERPKVEAKADSSCPQAGETQRARAQP
jgi:hypothetical protein